MKLNIPLPNMSYCSSRGSSLTLELWPLAGCIELWSVLTVYSVKIPLQYWSKNCTLGTLMQVTLNSDLQVGKIHIFANFDSTLSVYWQKVAA